MTNLQSADRNATACSICVFLDWEPQALADVLTHYRAPQDLEQIVLPNVNTYTHRSPKATLYGLLFSNVADYQSQDSLQTSGWPMPYPRNKDMHNSPLVHPCTPT